MKYGIFNLCSECRHEFAPGYFAIGAKKVRTFGENVSEDASIRSALGGQIGKCDIFSRCEVNKKMMHSKSYKRVTKRNTYTICYVTETMQKCYGQVSYFFAHTPSCNSVCSNVCNFHIPTYWALICKLDFSESNRLNFSKDDANLRLPIAVKSPHICSLKKPIPNDFYVLPISKILEVVSCVDFDNDDNVLYVSHAPNQIEKD